MHPALVFTASYGPRIANWLFARRSDLGEVYTTLVRPISDALGGAGRIERIGGTLVELRNGQAEAIGLLHQHTDKLDHLATAIDGVWIGQEATRRSLDLLHTVSAISLGLSALSHAVLHFQLRALTRRVERLAVEIRQVKDMLRAEHLGKLTAGLTLFKNGLDVASDDPHRAVSLFDGAAADLTRSSANYAQQLLAVGTSNPAYSWVVARHLMVSALAEAAAFLRSGHRLPALRAITTALEPLRLHARAVFARTVGMNTAEFLMPALVETGITLESVAELHRQAVLAGVVPEAGAETAADVFERLRTRLHRATDPRMYKSAKVGRLRAAFAEATAAVEEVNRLRGLELAILAYHTTGQRFDQLAESIVEQVRAMRPADGTCLAVFPTKPERAEPAGTESTNS